MKPAALILVVLALALPTAAGAITGGSPDGTAHPYVGLVRNGSTICSGSLVSPTVVVTAAHCFTDSVLGTDAQGHPIVRVEFDPRGINTPTSERVYFDGSFIADPQFCNGCLKGQKGNEAHDLAVVVLPAAVPTSVVPRYAQLSTAAPADGAGVDAVGFGAQELLKKDPIVYGTRSTASTFLTDAGVIAPTFVELAPAKKSDGGSICFGDSGGPVLASGTDVVLAVSSFTTKADCTGAGYGYRVDTANARSFLAPFLD